MTSDQLQEWLDKLALTELLAVLSAAVDRGDRETIIDCYAEESYDDHGAFPGTCLVRKIKARGGRRPGLRSARTRLYSIRTSSRPHPLDRPHQSGIHDPVAERLD